MHQKNFTNSNRNSNFTHNNLSSLPTTQIHLKFFSSYLTFSNPRRRARHLYLALLLLIFTVSFSGASAFISSSVAMYSLSSAHLNAASSIARSTLPAFDSIKILHKKSAVSSAEFGL